MGIINDAKGIYKTGLPMVQAYDSAMSSINSLKKNLEDFNQKIVDMKANSQDFTEED